MERMDKILTQEEYIKIRSEITRLEMEQTLKGKDNSKKIQELSDLITQKG